MFPQTDEALDMFPQTDEVKREQFRRLDACGDGSLDVKKR